MESGYAQRFFAQTFIMFVSFQSVSHHGGSHVAAVPHVPLPLPQVAFKSVLSHFCGFLSVPALTLHMILPSIFLTF